MLLGEYVTKGEAIKNVLYWSTLLLLKLNSNGRNCLKPRSTKDTFFGCRRVVDYWYCSELLAMVIIESRVVFLVGFIIVFESSAGHTPLDCLFPGWTTPPTLSLVPLWSRTTNCVLPEPESVVKGGNAWVWRDDRETPRCSWSSNIW